MTTAPANASAYGAEVEEGYAKVRAATARFRVLDSAVTAGYVASVPQCVADSVHGAMGYHHINRALLDNKVEVEHPEFLIYERMPDGAYVLNGVEYIVPFRVWPKDSVPPKLLGRDMLKNEALSLWNLHMWVWSKNPSGLFAEWNPAVQCPSPKADARGR
jgi:hypothetical protein